jgi:hypothetical protein
MEVTGWLHALAALTPPLPIVTCVGAGVNSSSDLDFKRLVCCGLQRQ